ncbi:MAG: hypothetical protein Q8M29_11440 [Bacteroidota bacterium]|nr:hypothetical protein [Bacteroidota bacterium]
MKKLLCIFVIGLYSCSRSDHYGLGEFDTINTSDAVKFMFTKHALQAKKEGVSTKLNYLSHSLESFWIVPNHKTEIGSDSLKKLYAAWDKQNKIIDYKINNVHVFPINKVAAAYHYQIELSYSDSIKKQLNQLESGVVIKIENDWLYLNSQTVNIE